MGWGLGMGRRREGKVGRSEVSTYVPPSCQPLIAIRQEYSRWNNLKTPVSCAGSDPSFYVTSSVLAAASCSMAGTVRHAAFISTKLA